MTFMKLPVHRPFELELQKPSTIRSRLKSLRPRKGKEPLRGSTSLTETCTRAPEMGVELEPATLSPIARPRSDSTQQNETTSPLLRLPAELRNQIYEYILGGKSICLTSREERPIGEIAPRRTPPTSGYGPDDVERDVLQLLRVCRQINNETRQLPFTLNVFRYSNALRDLEVWKQTNPGYLSFIKSVRLYSNGYSNEGVWLEGLKYFPNLKKLEVAVHYLRRPSRTLDLETEAFAALRSWESDLETRARAMTNSQLQVVFFHR